MHRLHGNFVYLAGPMDKAHDGGVGWRAEITPLLNELGVMVYSPTCKPMLGDFEDETDKETRQKWGQAGEFSKIGDFVKKIRRVDLRMVDLADFIIAHINPDVHMCGTYEEITLANRQKKPIMCFCEQGQESIPWWLRGMLPPTYFFTSMEDIISRLREIDTSSAPNVDDRWCFFNRESLFSQIGVCI